MVTLTVENLMSAKVGHPKPGETDPGVPLYEADGSPIEFDEVAAVLCPVTLAMLRASQGRRWEGRRTKAHLTCVEDEDASSGVTGRSERGKRHWSGH